MPILLLPHGADPARLPYTNQRSASTHNKGGIVQGNRAFGDNSTALNLFQKRSVVLGLMNLFSFSDFASVVVIAVTSWFWARSTARDKPTYPTPATVIFNVFILVSFCYHSIMGFEPFSGSVILLVPFSKLPQALSYSDLWCKSKVSFQSL